MPQVCQGEKSVNVLIHLYLIALKECNSATPYITAITASGYLNKNKVFCRKKKRSLGSATLSFNLFLDRVKFVLYCFPFKLSFSRLNYFINCLVYCKFFDKKVVCCCCCFCCYSSSVSFKGTRKERDFCHIK